MNKNDIISHNPFDSLPDFNKLKNNDSLNLIIPSSKLTDFTEDVLKSIDFNDRKYINRAIELEQLLEDPKLEELTESIFFTGLINPVYLQEKGNGQYRILSGFRRSVAIKNGYDNYDNYEFEGQVIILPDSIDKEDLEKISIHENLHREELKLSELAFKIYKDSTVLGKSFDDIADDYCISAGYAKRLKATVNYDKELIEILNEVGIKKAEILNRLIKILRTRKTVSQILEEYQDLPASDLEEELKALKANEIKPMFEIKANKKTTTVKINKSLNEEQLKAIKEFIAGL